MFTITSGIGFVVGFAMIGSIVYLSIYLQVVSGSSPTVAGLQLLPLMVGLLITSIVSGRLITRTGRYKIYPIVGTGLATIALLMLSRLGDDTPYWQIAIARFVLGSRSWATSCRCWSWRFRTQWHRATSEQLPAARHSFGRSARSFGTAVFGAIWAARLTSELKEILPPGSSASGDPTSSMTIIRSLPPDLQSEVLSAFARATDFTFLMAVPIMAIAFVLAMFVPQITLRTTHD